MAKYNPRSYASSRFFCTECGSEGMSISRHKGKIREAGHLKKLYCLKCKREVNHAEVRDNCIKYTYEDFLEEFENGIFENGKRKEDENE